MFSRKINIVIQAISIVLFALVAALIPQYALLVFILYFILFMILMTRTGLKSTKSIDKSAGPLLFKESASAQAMMYDSLLTEELKSQFKSTIIYLILPFTAFMLIPLYTMFIEPYIRSFLQALGSGFLINFLKFIIMYLFLIGVIQGMRFLVSRKTKQQKQLLIPRSFTLYKKGLVVDGRFLEYSRDMCVKENRERKFIEIHGNKLPFIIRLYTLEVSKLYTKIREVGLSECREIKA
jgi:uncharacterized membrane protein